MISISHVHKPVQKKTAISTNTRTIRYPLYLPYKRLSPLCGLYMMLVVGNSHDGMHFLLLQVLDRLNIPEDLHNLWNQNWCSNSTKEKVQDSHKNIH